MKKTKNLYLDSLYALIKTNIIGLIICFIIFCGVCYINNRLGNARNKGEKTLATIVTIEEANPLRDPYKESREIRSMKIKFNYNGNTYIETTKSSYKNARVGDTFPVYIMNQNPKDFVEELPGNNNIIMSLLYGLITLVFLALLFSLFVTIKEIILYRSIENESSNVTAHFNRVEQGRYYMARKYYIICSSDEIDNKQRIFKSHPYNSDPTEKIKKHNFDTFLVKYKTGNPCKYIIDTNKLDKIL